MRYLRKYHIIVPLTIAVNNVLLIAVLILYAQREIETCGSEADDEGAIPSDYDYNVGWGDGDDVGWGDGDGAGGGGDGGKTTTEDEDLIKGRGGAKGGGGSVFRDSDWTGKGALLTPREDNTAWEDLEVAILEGQGEEGGAHERSVHEGGAREQKDVLSDFSKGQFG